MLLWHLHAGTDALQGLPATTARAVGVWSPATVLDDEALRHIHPRATTLDPGTDGHADRRRLPHDHDESELPEDVHLIARRDEEEHLYIYLVNKRQRV